MSYKDISYLELWWPFCSAGQNHLCNFEVGYQEEKFEPVVQEMSFKSFFSSGALLFHGVEPFVQF